MNGADAITNKILTQAEERAAHIAEENKEKCSVMLANEKKKAEAERRHMLAQAESDAAELIRRRKSVALLENKKAMLKMQQEMLDEVFSKAADELVSDKNLYRRTMLQIIACANISGDEMLCPSNADKEIFDQAFVDEINSIRISDGKKSAITMGPPSEISHGFVLKKGYMEMNYGIDAVMRYAHSALQAEVAKILF